MSMNRITLYLVVFSLLASVASAEEEVEQHPCTVSLVGVKTEERTAVATLVLKWSKAPADLKKEDMTIVVLFQAKLIARLKAELLALGSTYAFHLPKDGLMEVTRGISIKDNKGESYRASLMLFFADADSKVDFRKSSKQTIPIRIRRMDPWTEEPAIMGKGVLSFGLFKEDDPKFDQLHSLKYRQLSNVVNREVELK